jgi:capsular polysaccharide biosynthesis protein
MSDTTDITAQQADERRPTVISIVAGALVAVLILVAALLYAQSLDEEWTASATVLVLPGEPVNPDQVPAYYETLSRGQMVSTLAELVRLGDFQNETAERYALTPEQRDAYELQVTVVSGTAMMRVSATSVDPNLASAMADGVVDSATTYVGDLGLPYALIPISDAQDNLVETSPPTVLIVAVFGMVAVVLGIAYQQGIFRLARLSVRRGSRVLARGNAEQPIAADSGSDPDGESEDQALAEEQDRDADSDPALEREPDKAEAE